MSYFNKSIHSTTYSGMCVFAFLIWTAGMWAQAKPQLDVQLTLEYEIYQSYYDTEPGLSTQLVESTGADSIAAMLNRNFPFIEFTRRAVSSGITFTMSEGIVAEITVHPVLSLNSIEFHEADAFTFRDAVQALDDPPPSLEAFIQELQNIFSGWITDNKENLIKNLWGHIKVCDSALALPESKKWVMPFKMEDLQIGPRSSLQVVTRFDGVLGEEICDYNTIAQGPVTTTTLGTTHIGKMFCNIDQATVDSDCLANMNRGRIEGVYLTKFIALSRIETGPDGFDFSNQ